MAMRPASGSCILSRPAMSRRSVLLPAPDGPKTTVHGVASLHSMSRWKLPRRALRLSSTIAPLLPVPGPTCVQATGTRVDQDERKNAEDEQREGSAIGGGVVEAFYLVEEHDGEGARRAGDVSTEHQDYAELAQRMQK